MNRCEKKTLQLRTAFSAFNETSVYLIEQYKALEEKAEGLASRLAEVNSDRLKQLADKESLAERLQRIISALPSGLVVVAPDGKILEWNAKAEELLGIKLAGKSWQQINDECLSKSVLQAGELLLANGCRINLSVQKQNAKSDGKIVLLNDVTELRKLQDSLLHKEKLSATGQMIGKLAHQIRTPLASAFLYLSKIRKFDVLPAATNKALKKLHDCLSGLQQTVDDLLLYIRGQNPAMEWVSVKSIFEAVHMACKFDLNDSNVKLVFHHDAENFKVYVSRSAIEGAFINLVTNAIQASATEIIIESKMLDNEVLFSVKDNGQGIQGSYDEIFKPFYTTRNDGTGLGLAIVQAVAELHGGKVRIESNNKKGTLFEVRLPIQSEINLLPSDGGEEYKNSYVCY